MQLKTEYHRNPETIYGWCPWCSHEIQKGEPCVALRLQVEQQDPDVAVIATVDVLDSEGVIALCRDCGSALEEQSLRRLIHEQYRPAQS